MARKLAHELWPTSGVPGQLHQDLPTPTHFEQAATRVTVEEATASTPCGPDPERYVAAFREFVDAGFDEVAVTQIGPDQDGFFRFYERELRDRLTDDCRTPGRRGLGAWAEGRVNGLALRLGASTHTVGVR